MYSPQSQSAFSSGGPDSGVGPRAHFGSRSPPAPLLNSPGHSPRTFSSNYSTTSASQRAGASSAAYQQSTQCLRFKYFTTFFVCTTCLALLCASLATHKWIVSRPIRVLRLGGQQQANFTALMLSAALFDDTNASNQVHPIHQTATSTKSKQQELRPLMQRQRHEPAGLQQVANLLSTDQAQLQSVAGFSEILSGVGSSTSHSAGTKFQGEIYFGLFNGVKVLNYGFGDRVSQLSGMFSNNIQLLFRLSISINYYLFFQFNFHRNRWNW